MVLDVRSMSVYSSQDLHVKVGAGPIIRLDKHIYCQALRQRLSAPYSIVSYVWKTSPMPLQLPS